MIDRSCTISHLFHTGLVSLMSCIWILDGKLNFLMKPALDTSVITIDKCANSGEVAKTKRIETQVGEIELCIKLVQK